MLNKQFEERSIENEKLLEIVTNTENFEEDSLSLKRNRSFTVNNTTKYCNTNLFEDKVLSFKYSQTEIKADSLIKQITSADQVNLLTNKELKEEISMEIKAQNKVTNCKVSNCFFNSNFTENLKCLLLILERRRSQAGEGGNKMFQSFERTNDSERKKLWRDSN